MSLLRKKTKMEKRTNISKYATKEEASKAFYDYCDQKGLTPTREAFNKWCWDIAPECLEYRPFPISEALKLIGEEFRRKDGKGYFVCSTVWEDDKGVVHLNSGLTAEDLLKNWVFAVGGNPAGVVKE